MGDIALASKLGPSKVEFNSDSFTMLFLVIFYVFKLFVFRYFAFIVTLGAGAIFGFFMIGSYKSAFKYFLFAYPVSPLNDFDVV